MIDTNTFGVLQILSPRPINKFATNWHWAVAQRFQKANFQCSYLTLKFTFKGMLGSGGQSVLGAK